MPKRRTKAQRESGRRLLLWGLTAATAIALAVLVMLPERGAEKPPAADSERTVEALSPAPAPERGVAAPPAVPAGKTSTPAVATSKKAPAREPAKRTGPPPKIAIVIDDVGHSMSQVEDLLQLELPLTYAVIPHLRYSSQASRSLASKGQEVILHQPMEPIEYPGVPLEEGGILVGMLSSEVERILEKNLRSVPDAKGVNNHKGSRATQDAALMRAFMKAAHGHGLYFLDSRTSADTVAEQVAREMGVPAVRRHVFLDNDNEVEKIHAQLRELIRVAKRDGEAVGIGHAKSSMVWALETARPWLSDGSVELVPASKLLR